MGRNQKINPKEYLKKYLSKKEDIRIQKKKDKKLRKQKMEGDPMLNFIREKKVTSSTEKPTYQGSFMPNRFGIKPGYRWDGVDRGNGYEKKWFEMINMRKAAEQERYRWSTADM